MAGRASGVIDLSEPGDPAFPSLRVDLERIERYYREIGFPVEERLAVIRAARAQIAREAEEKARAAREAAYRQRQAEREAARAEIEASLGLPWDDHPET